MNTFSIWKNDMKEILKSNYMIVAVIAVILVPLVYGGLYLAAFWDPYGSTDQLPVVVVNLDKGYITDDDKKLDIGKDIVSSLGYNDDIGWIFETDLAKAEDGLINEGYYAMYVIPEDFSESINGVSEGELVQPVIKYIPNEKKNYIVSLINKKASGAIETSVSKSLSGAFTGVIFEQLEYLKDKINTGSEAVYLIEGGVDKLKGTVPKLQDGLEKVNEGTVLLEEKLGDANDGLLSLNDAVSSLNTKIPDLADGVEKIYEASGIFEERFDELHYATRTLNDALSSYNGKMPDLKDATTSLADASGKITTNLETLSEKSTDVKIAVETITNGLDELLEGLKGAADGSDKLTEKFDLVEAGFLQLSDVQVNSTKTNLMALKGLGVPALNASVDKTIASLDAVYAFDYYDFEKRQYIADAEKEVKMAYAEVDKLMLVFEKDYKTLVNILKMVLPGVEAKLNGAIATAATPPSKMDTMTIITLSKTVSALDAQVNANPDIAIKSLEALAKGKVSIQAYGVSNKTLSTGLSGTAVVGLDMITDGSHQLKKSMPKFEGAVDLLAKYSGFLNSNVEKLDKKIPDLEQGVSLIDANVVKLTSAVLKLHGASEKMLEGAEELNAKVPDLGMGMELVADGSSKIGDGVLKLYSASGTLDEGVTTLNGKMPDLIDGVNSLYDATGSLATKLDAGSDLISDAVVIESNRMSAYMTTPLLVETNAIYEVDNYGTGFSPYFIALGLWVGALVMFFIIPSDRGAGVGAKEYVFGKYFTYATIGVVQAIILSIVILLIGLRPSNYILYFMFNIMLSLVFISILQFLIYLFDDPGRLIGMVFLLLQLTSCGGTFSVELVPTFFQNLSPFMPFTYAISGLREIISGINGPVLIKSVVVLIIIQIISLLALYFGMKYKDKIDGKKATSKSEDLLPSYSLK